MAEKIDYSKGIYDAKQLGTPKLLILGAQHMFAMFGATVLVPLLTGLSVSTTLLCAGLGTLLFHFLCKGKVPAFLGSSFAYLGGFTIVTNGGANPENLPYACAAVALSGLVYVLFSGLITAFGIRKMMKFFPPVERRGRIRQCAVIFCQQQHAAALGQQRSQPVGKLPRPAARQHVGRTDDVAPLRTKVFGTVLVRRVERDGAHGSPCRAARSGLSGRGPCRYLAALPHRTPIKSR